MAKKGKKYVEAAKLVERSKAYDVSEAVALVKKTNTAKFDATVEVAFRLGVDTRKNDQQIRGAVVLPNGTGKTQRVLVFAKGEKRKKLKLLVQISLAILTTSTKFNKAGSISM
ncbi:50S ribosomal protein L1 [Bacillus tequilensis]|nr:50S ribosomal protein L1 [Bacillus tequilensis]